RPARVARIPPPGSGADLAAALDAALVELDGSLAATFLDGSLMSDGIYTPEASELRLLVERTHAAGGVYVADEVQAGHGRLGPELWSFARHGIAPDVVGLGKPDIVEVRGSGLLAGVQLSSGELAARVAEELRDQGILVGLTGKREDVLKIRPPLVFTDQHGELLVSALSLVLG